MASGLRRFRLNVGKKSFMKSCQVFEQAVQENVQITITGNVQQTSRCGTYGHSSAVNMTVPCKQLDLKILKVFSDLNYPMILFYDTG